MNYHGIETADFKYLLYKLRTLMGYRITIGAIFVFIVQIIVILTFIPIVYILVESNIIFAIFCACIIIPILYNLISSINLIRSGSRRTYYFNSKIRSFIFKLSGIPYYLYTRDYGMSRNGIGISVGNISISTGNH